MDRRFTFKDPEIVRKLQTEFVPVTGDCKELQWGNSSEGMWFMDVVRRTKDTELREQLKPQGDDGNTAQGLYICGPDGKSYGWFNSHYVEGVREFLDKGLAEFRRNPPAPVQISARGEAPWMAPDSSTSVVRIFTRIRPVPQGSDDLNNGVGRDHFWILSDEVKEIASDVHDDGRQFQLPTNLVSRLVRFHLLDNVRGEPDLWQPAEVKQATFNARLMGRNGSTKCYEFNGVYAQRTSDNRRGIQGTIEGRIDIADGGSKILHFRAYSQPVTWGESRFTPGAPPGRFNLAIAMVETNDRISKIVPPEFMGEGSDYLKPEFLLAR